MLDSSSVPGQTGYHIKTCVNIYPAILLVGSDEVTSGCHQCFPYCINCVGGDLWPRFVHLHGRIIKFSSFCYYPCDSSQANMHTLYCLDFWLLKKLKIQLVF